MGHAAERTKISEQGYLALERAAEERHEYADGEIFAMPGGRWEHGLIASNINCELRAALVGRPCVAQGADMRIHFPATGRYTVTVHGPGRLKLESRTIMGESRAGQVSPPA